MFVISGPSGVGKGTLVRRLLELRPDLHLSVSVTTRSPRPTERDGVDYTFVSDERFDELVRGGELIEWAEVVGNRYGTPADPVEEARDGGRDVVFEIDVQGARLVKERAPDAVLIFLAPPTWGELTRRLRERGTEDRKQLAARLETAATEMAARTWFDHVVVNDDLDRAAREVAGIIAETPPDE